MRRPAIESASSTCLEFRQSTGRALLGRLYRAGGEALILAGGVLLASMFGLPERHLVPGLALALGIPILISVWLLAFNSGAVRLPSQVVQLSPAGIEVRRYDDVEMMRWDEIGGVCTRGILFRRIVIGARRGRPLTLDFYSLAAGERHRLFHEIERQQAARLSADETAGRPTIR